MLTFTTTASEYYWYSLISRTIVLPLLLKKTLEIIIMTKLTTNPINAPNALPAKSPANVDTKAIAASIPIAPIVALILLLRHSKYTLVLVVEAETFNPIATLAVASHLFPALPQYGHLPV